MTKFTLLRPAPRTRAISILPLINVVFLLLIFIVVSGVISSPDPFELHAVQSALGDEASDAGSDNTIYVSATGEIQFRTARGKSDVIALAHALATASAVEKLTVRADASAPAVTIVDLVEALRGSALSGLHLQAERRE